MPRQVKISIDGQEITALEGEKILWVALDNGIYIPNLCAIREAARPAASCRLCFVEVEGLPQPVPACAHGARDGLVVHTRSPRVDRLVARAFELLLTHHRLGCSRCPKNGACALQTIARERKLKLRPLHLKPLPLDLPTDDSPATFAYDPSRCVLCGRCVWACTTRSGVGALGFVQRGLARRVATFGNVPLAESSCTECGECVKVCPVGALFFKEPGPAGLAEPSAAARP